MGIKGESREIRYETIGMIQWKDGQLDKGDHSEREKSYGFNVYLKYELNCWVGFE